MSAAIDNKYAQKWTEEKVKLYLEKIESAAKDDDTLYLGEALAALRITRKAWSYWKRIYAQHEDIMEQIELIEELYEIKLFRGAMKEGLPITMTIFALKNNHHWTDKPAIESIASPHQGTVVALADDVIVCVDVQGVTGTFKRVLPDWQIS